MFEGVNALEPHFNRQAIASIARAPGTFTLWLLAVDEHAATLISVTAINLCPGVM
jgi:hypothetical protein